MHSPAAHRFREQWDRRTRTLLYMMTGLSGNWVWIKLQWDGVQQKELSLGMNWCSWSLERPMPPHTHTQALNNPELLHNDISNRHSKSNKYTISNKMGKISLDFPHIMTDSRKHGCFKSVQILKRSLAKGCFKAMHAVICLIVTPRRLLFYLQLINPVL